jgi:hypothetical protein
MTPTYVAWYEMFPAGSVEIFGVNAGDEIQPAVAFADGRFALSIADASTGQSQSFTAAPGGAGGRRPNGSSSGPNCAAAGAAAS